MTNQLDPKMNNIPHQTPSGAMLHSIISRLRQSLFGSAPDHWTGGMILLLGVYAFAVCPFAVNIQGDGGGLLNFIPRFQIVYPLALQLFGPFLVTLLQTILYAASVLYLAVQSFHSTQSRLFATVLAILMISNPDLNWYHGVIMSESFFVSASVAFLASVLRFFRLREASIVPVAVFAGLAAALRPPGYGFLPAVVLMIFMMRHRLDRRFARTLGLSLLIMLAITGSERLGWRLIHGPEARGYAGQQIYAKAALVDAPAQTVPETDPARRVLVRGLEEDFKPIREIIRKAPTSNIEQFLTVYYEECLEFGCSYPLAAELGKQTDDPDLNDLKLKVALERIARAPLDYMRVVWVHYRSMWHIYAHNYPGLMDTFKQFADPLRPLPFSDVKQTQIFNTDFPPKKIALLARPAVIAIGIITFLAALTGLYCVWKGRTSPILGAAAVGSLAAHGALVLTAMLGIGIARYTMAIWPEMVVGSLFALWAVWKALKKQDI